MCYAVSLNMLYVSQISPEAARGMPKKVFNVLMGMNKNKQLKHKVIKMEIKPQRYRLAIVFSHTILPVYVSRADRFSKEETWLHYP